MMTYVIALSEYCIDHGWPISHVVAETKNIVLV